MCVIAFECYKFGKRREVCLSLTHYRMTRYLKDNHASALSPDHYPTKTDIRRRITFTGSASFKSVPSRS